jgi:hypothetical protein
MKLYNALLNKIKKSRKKVYTKQEVLHLLMETQLSIYMGEEPKQEKNLSKLKTAEDWIKEHESNN